MASCYPQGRDQRGRQHTPTGNCRDCSAAIVWATTPSGKRIPLDPGASSSVDVGLPARPYLLIEEADHWRLAIELRDPGVAEEVLDVRHSPLYSCHFDTCTERRPRQRADLA